jgi:hypothetical protein
MIRRMLSILCIIVFMLPVMMLHAQNDVPVQQDEDELKVSDTESTTETVKKTTGIDSVDAQVILPDSLAVNEPVAPADLLVPQTSKNLAEYEFKGTSKDILIGAAVLGGWLFVTYLAANQRSD